MCIRDSDLAYMILSERKEQMHLMASVLLERETVDGEACEALLNNEWDAYLEREQEAKKADTKAKAKALMVAPSTMPASGDVVISGDLPKDPAGADDSSRDMVSFDNPNAVARQREAVSFTDPAAEDIPMPSVGRETTDGFSEERKDHN